MEAQEERKDELALKWGTLKRWHIQTDAAQEALARYFAEPTSIGAAQQKDTETQKDALCDLIDAVNCDVLNDWTGEFMSKDEAKTYVRDYGRPQVAAQ